MKIGILTFHRAENFGAVLQCLALQNYLISKGNEVEVIDYRNPSIEHQYDIFNPWCIFQTKSLYGGFCVYVKRFFNFRSRLRKKVLYWKFRNKYIQTSKSYYSNCKLLPYDAIIVGSDQVWNLNLCDGIDNIYFLHFPTLTGTKKISYAASSELNSFALLREHKQEIANLLNAFDDISVRERQLQAELNDFVSKEISICIDPTFLMPRKSYEEIAIKPVERKYVLVYHLTENSDASKLAETISKEQELSVIEIHAGFFKTSNKKRHKNSLGPRELLGYIMNADFIITTSFHGMALSLIFAKQFVVMRTATINRMQNLLSAVGLENRIIDGENDYNGLDPINYDKVNKRINEEVSKSKLFLRKSLGQ